MKLKYLVAMILLMAVGLVQASPSNNNGNNGNNGGDVLNQGGQGGQGVGIGIAGASASAIAGVNSNISNSITNRNTNSNVNRNTNAQGQLQGQQQGQGQQQSTDNANNSSQNVNIEGDNFNYRRNPVSTAYAPSIAPTANCALSVSGGVQAIGFGASFGKAYIDENCAALEQVRNVALVLKDVQTAEALMCQDKKYAKARATAGRACPVEQE